MKLDDFSRAVAAIRGLKDDGIIAEYAVGGAMALIFWSEPTATFDLDVFVLLRSTTALVSLEPLYTWARTHGYREEAEHIIISGIPVQLIPAHNPLAVEAVQNAADLDYDGHPVRVITPEYLIAMYLEPGARSRKRQARVAALLDEGNVDRTLLDALLERYNLALPEQ